jgi:hypothetical protein
LDRAATTAPGGSCEAWVALLNAASGPYLSAGRFAYHAQWQELLGECGFEVQSMPMSEGTPFANVLLLAHADR